MDMKDGGFMDCGGGLEWRHLLASEETFSLSSQER